jgi:hypothetical protein
MPTTVMMESLAHDLDLGSHVNNTKHGMWRVQVSRNLREQVVLHARDVGQGARGARPADQAICKHVCVRKNHTTWARLALG